MQLEVLVRHLDELLKPQQFSDVSANGLQIEGTPKIFHMATAVSASLATIEAAVKAGVQVLIVHHGIFWERDNPAIVGSKKEKIQLLLEHGISLLAYHLPLDAHQSYGNNWGAARLLGWQNLEPFGAYKGMFIGVKGSVEKLSREDFAGVLENFYGHIAYTAFGGSKEIATAALISGGAHRSITEASAAGIDAFITGSFDEPTWHQAYEEKINFYALGHSNTEKIGPQLLATHLQSTFQLPCGFIDVPNPF